jgi:hypothetical protein
LFLLARLSINAIAAFLLFRVKESTIIPEKIRIPINIGKMLAVLQRHQHTQANQAGYRIQARFKNALYLM